jgi:hypothetical protein
MGRWTEIGTDNDVAEELVEMGHILDVAAGILSDIAHSHVDLNRTLQDSTIESWRWDQPEVVLTWSEADRDERGEFRHAYSVFFILPHDHNPISRIKTLRGPWEPMEIKIFRSVRLYVDREGPAGFTCHSEVNAWGDADFEEDRTVRGWKHRELASLEIRNHQELEQDASDLRAIANQAFEEVSSWDANDLQEFNGYG